jgi:predicted transcriptional regulator
VLPSLASSESVRADIRIGQPDLGGAPLRYHNGMAMTLRLPPEVEEQLKQVAEIEHRSMQQTVLVAIEEYLSLRETAEILADPAALRGLAEAHESDQAGDVLYGAAAARALLADRQR